MHNGSNALEIQPPVVPDTIGFSAERQQELGGVASRMLGTFFQGKNLGTTKSSVPGRVFPWVRYLVWDSLKPELGQGISKYADVRWRDDDKFLTDLRDLARKVAKVVPKGIDGNEWRFIAQAAYNQLLERADPDEQYQITMESLIRGPSDKQFETYFDQWAEIIEGEAREIK